MTEAPDGTALTERLRAERDERRRLAELIHDGPVQLVAAVSQMLDAAQRALEDGDTASGGEIVKRALEVSREASADLREIVSGIEPAALREHGLPAAIRELADRFAARRGIVFDLDLATSLELGDSAESGLYQLVREALDQSVRRGRPTNVAITLAASGGGVSLEIVDDGAQERRDAVLGALGERAGELNGTFESVTTDEGTRIVVRLPPVATHL